MKSPEPVRIFAKKLVKQTMITLIVKNKRTTMLQDQR
jgi:hypothetical protein